MIILNLSFYHFLIKLRFRLSKQVFGKHKNAIIISLRQQFIDFETFKVFQSRYVRSWCFRVWITNVNIAVALQKWMKSVISIQFILFFTIYPQSISIVWNVLQKLVANFKLFKFFKTLSSLWKATKGDIKGIQFRCRFNQTPKMDMNWPYVTHIKPNDIVGTSLDRNSEGKHYVGTPKETWCRLVMTQNKSKRKTWNNLKT